LDDTGRRDSLRIKARLKVRFRDASAFITEYTHNISKGGIFVRTTKPCEPGSMVEVKLVIPESEREVSATGEVIHVVKPEEATEHQPAGMGVHLQKMADADREAIEEFIREKIDSGKAKDGLGRRRHERYQARIRVKFGSKKALIEEYTHNISHGGIFIKTEKPRALGEKLRITLIHPESGEEIFFDGEVVRVVTPEEATSNQPAGMGIKFSSLDVHARAQLNSFISSDHVQKNTSVDMEEG